MVQARPTNPCPHPSIHLPRADGQEPAQRRRLRQVHGHPPKQVHGRQGRPPPTRRRRHPPKLASSTRPPRPAMLPPCWWCWLAGASLLCVVALLLTGTNRLSRSGRCCWCCTPGRCRRRACCAIGFMVVHCQPSKHYGDSMVHDFTAGAVGRSNRSIEHRRGVLNA